VANSYKDREAQIVGNLYHDNPVFEFLIKPYCKL
jgi:hypothetical protein